MRRISVLVLLSLLSGGCAGPKRMPPVVSEPSGPEGPGRQMPSLLGVGLLENQSQIVVQAAGPAELLDGHSGAVLLHLPAADRQVSCERAGDRVRWRQGAEEDLASAVVLRPLDAATWVKQGDETYRGELLVICAPEGGGLTLVNTLDLESYLKGVVPWEIGRHPAERMAALQAQAVAARTYTLAHWGARRARGFDVFASVMDQVYRGSAGEDLLCNKAVESTSGLVLQDHGKEIEAFYSACCGGTSSNIEEVWARSGRSYLRSAADGPDSHGHTFCADSPHFQWRESWTASQLTEILGRTLPAYLDWLAESPARTQWAGSAFSPRDGSSDARHPGALRNLEILSHTTSGRVADLAVTTNAGVYHVRGDRTRWVLPPAGGKPFILRSAMFDLALESASTQLRRVVITGRGYGHGVGLCQTGSLARAEQGQSYQEILAHYYPGAVLTRLAATARD